MFCLFDQDYNEKNAHVTGEKYGLIRDLSKVWKSEKVANSDLTLDKSTTLMLETDEITVYNCHENSLIVDRFERRDIWPMAGDTDFRDQPEILRLVKEDVFKVLDQCRGDVQEYLKKEDLDFSQHTRAAKKLEPRGTAPEKNPVDELTKEMEKI